MVAAMVRSVMPTTATGSMDERVAGFRRNDAKRRLIVARGSARNDLKVVALMGRALGTLADRTANEWSIAYPGVVCTKGVPT